MEALKLIRSTIDGVLRIEVPDHFRNTKLEVTVKPFTETEVAISNKPSIQSFLGTAKYPDTPVNKYDVYQQ